MTVILDIIIIITNTRREQMPDFFELLTAEIRRRCRSETAHSDAPRNRKLRRPPLHPRVRHRAPRSTDFRHAVVSALLLRMRRATPLLPVKHVSKLGRHLSFADGACVKSAAGGRHEDLVWPNDRCNGEGRGERAMPAQGWDGRRGATGGDGDDDWEFVPLYSSFTHT